MSEFGKAPLEDEAVEQLAHQFLVSRRTVVSAGSSSEYAALRDTENGLRVAGKLGQLLAAEGVGISGLKMGALAPDAQRAMGLAGPIVAPLYEEWMLSGGASVSLDQFIEPKLEAEVGFRLVKGAWVAVACLEIADSRITGWSGRGGQIIADFALNGAIVYGTDLAQITETSYELRRDGELIAHGRTSVADAARRMEGDAARSGARFVASGALHPLTELKQGVWSLRFREGGEAIITVGTGGR